MGEGKEATSTKTKAVDSSFPACLWVSGSSSLADKVRRHVLSVILKSSGYQKYLKGAVVVVGGA